MQYISIYMIMVPFKKKLNISLILANFAMWDRKF